MSERRIAEADWKKSAKGNDYKDAALIKALAVLQGRIPAAARAGQADAAKLRALLALA